MEDKNLKKTIYLFYLSKFLVGLRFFIPIWLIFGKHFLNLPQLGLLESLSCALAILIDIPSGALADIVGRKNIIIVGWIFVALGHAGQGLANSIFIYILWGLISTIAAAFVSGTDTAFVYDALKEKGESNKFSSVNSKGLFSYRVGIIFATFLGGFLYQVNTFVPFVCMGLAEFLSVFCWWFMKEPKMEHIVFSWKSYVNQMKDGVNQVFKSSFTKSLSLFYIIIGGISFTSLYFFNYSYAIDLKFNAIQQSYLFGFTGILKALVVLVFAKYAKKLTKNQIFLGFMFFMVISYLPSMFVGKNIAILIIALTEIIAVARFAFLDQLINDELESKHRATTLSFMNTMVNLVYLIIVTIGGYIANRFNTAYLYTLLGVIIVLTIVPTTLKLISIKKYYSN